MEKEIWQSDARLSISKKRKRNKMLSLSLTTSSFPGTDIHKVASIDEPIVVQWARDP